MKQLILSLGGAILVAACGGGPASADDDTPRLHPVKEACVSYEMSGQMQSGTTIRCHRDYGYELYEIQNISIGFAGFKQTQSQHNITIGETIYAIDLGTNKGTKTTNPMYEGIVGALEDTSAENISDAFMNAMGLTAAGSTQTIAGAACNDYSSSMMGTACMTDDGLILEQTVMGNVMRATSVSYEPGEDANYTLHQTVPITDGPDLSNGINGIDLSDFMGQQ